MKYATITVSLLIIVAVLIPGSKIPSVQMVGFDKIVHFGLFALWATAVRYDFDAARIKFLHAFIIGALFGVFTEILQVFVEDRTLDWYDVLADVLGLAAGLAISKKVLAMFPKRRS